MSDNTEAPYLDDELRPWACEECDHRCPVESPCDVCGENPMAEDYGLCAHCDLIAYGADGLEVSP